MFMDEHRCTIWDQLRQLDLRAFGDILTPDLFEQAARDAGITIGKSALNLANLVRLALSAALRPNHSFTSLLTVTLSTLEDGENWAASPMAGAQRNGRRRQKRRKGRRSRHDPRRDDPTVVSEEAFCKARRAMPRTFWTALIFLLAGRFEQKHAATLRWKRFRLLAIDGTLVGMQRHKSLAKHFGTARNGKGKGKTPRARMVMLQFPMTRVPLIYELTPLSDSEKTVATRLLKKLRPNDLLLMDRGFWSYGLFWQIANSDAYFGVRRFKSAKLTTCKQLSSSERLAWYAPTDPKWRKQGLPKEMKLRVIDYQMKGFRPSQIVTNALDPREISRAEWIQMAKANEAGELLREPGLYHRRWEIETTYQELKTFQGMEQTLRSRTPASIEYELAGHVLLYSLIRWMMVEAATAHGVQDPLRLSFTDALRELTDMLVTLLISSPRHAHRVLRPRLLQRVANHRVPYRPGRHYPRPKDNRNEHKLKTKRRKSKTPTKNHKPTTTPIAATQG